MPIGMPRESTNTTSARACGYGPHVPRRHPLSIARSTLLVAVLASFLMWLRVGDDEGDGAVLLPVLAFPVGAYAGYLIGLALHRE